MTKDNTLFLFDKLIHETKEMSQSEFDSRLKEIEKSQIDLSPEIVNIVNDNFWSLF